MGSDEGNWFLRCSCSKCWGRLRNDVLVVVLALAALEEDVAELSAAVVAALPPRRLLL